MLPHKLVFVIVPALFLLLFRSFWANEMRKNKQTTTTKTLRILPGKDAKFFVISLRKGPLTRDWLQGCELPNLKIWRYSLGWIAGTQQPVCSTCRICYRIGFFQKINQISNIQDVWLFDWSRKYQYLPNDQQSNINILKCAFGCSRTFVSMEEVWCTWFSGFQLFPEKHTKTPENHWMEDVFPYWSPIEILLMEEIPNNHLGCINIGINYLSTGAGFLPSLGGGFKHFLFSPRNLGKMNPFWRAYFSNGLVQPPTRSTVISLLGGIPSKFGGSKAPHANQCGISMEHQRSPKKTCFFHEKNSCLFGKPSGTPYF